MSITTVVSAFYHIPSKQPLEFYLPHVKRFLENLECPLVFFTSSELIDLMKEFRKQHLDKTCFFVLEIENWISIKKYGVNFWLDQSNKSIQYVHHERPYLGAIWYEKKEFVLRAIENNVFNSDVFIWCDAGCVRYDEWIPYLKTFGNNTDVILKDKIMVQCLQDIPDKIYFDYPDIYIAGAIIVGYKEMWSIYSEMYEKVLLLYLRNNIMIFDDQYINASMCVLYRKYMEPVKLNVIKENIPDKWFFFLKYLSTV